MDASAVVQRKIHGNIVVQHPALLLNKEGDAYSQKLMFLGSDPATMVNRRQKIHENYKEDGSSKECVTPPLIFATRRRATNSRYWKVTPSALPSSTRAAGSRRIHVREGL